MKKLNDTMAKRFYNMCVDIKDTQTREDLIFRVGVAIGFTSALFLSDVINVDCYTAMNQYITAVSKEMIIND